MRCYSVFYAACFFLLATCTNSSGEQWNRFRGPQGAGLASDIKIPSQWNEQAYRWVSNLPGVGISSPIIWEDSVYVTAADEQTETRWLVCIDRKSGKESWRQANKFASYKKHKNNSFASSTPAADAKHVYQLWHSKKETLLLAYTHDGEEVWRYDLGPYLHGQGGATSPVVSGDCVLIAHDHKTDSYLAAIDAAKGELRWKIPREGQRACYATPAVRLAKDGVQEVVFSHCYEGILGVDLKTGKKRWHADPFGRTSQRALTSPVLAGDLVIAGSGAVGGERQIVAIRTESSDGNLKAEESYRVTRQAPHVPTPLVIGERLYLWGDGGIATCCDASSGDIIWQKRIGGNYFASPVAAGNRIFNIDTLGKVVVIAAAEEFEVLGRNEMGEGSRATMAVGDETLYVRTHSKLFAIGD